MDGYKHFGNKQDFERLMNGTFARFIERRTGAMEIEPRPNAAIPNGVFRHMFGVKKGQATKAQLLKVFTIECKL